MQNKETRTIRDSEIRASQTDNQMQISGLIVYDSPSQDLGGFVEVLRAGCFKDSISSRDIYALWNHNDDIPLGCTKNSTLALEDTPQGLRYTITLNPNDADAQRAYEKVNSGLVDGSSFAFSCVRDEKKMVNGQMTRFIDSAILYECSPVVFPAYLASYSEVQGRSLNEFLDKYHVSEDEIKEIAERKMKEEQEKQEARKEIANAIKNKWINES